MYSILIWTRHSMKCRHLKPRTKNKTYVVMFEKTQHLQFPVSPFRRRETLKNVRHLLQSDPLSIPRICHRPDEIRGNIVKRKLQNTTNSAALTAGIYSPHYAESSITDRSIRLGFLLCLRSVMWTVAARRRLLGVRRGERHESPALAHSNQRRDASATRVILVPWCWRLRSVACSAACWKGEGKSLKRESDFLLHPLAWDRLTQLFLGRVVRTEWDCWTFERTCGGVAKHCSAHASRNTLQRKALWACAYDNKRSRKL